MHNKYSVSFFIESSFFYLQAFSLLISNLSYISKINFKMICINKCYFNSNFKTQKENRLNKP